MDSLFKLPRQRFRVGLVLMVLGFLLLSSFRAGVARADLILNIKSATRNANAGDTVTFTGTITNTTGVTLNATDMFLDFSGYNAAIRCPNITQLLGTPDFVLLNNHISASVALFSVTIGSIAQPGHYPISTILQDINNNSSSIVTGTVHVQASSGGVVPEPSSWLLAATVFAELIFFSFVRRRKQSPACHACV